MDQEDADGSSEESSGSLVHVASSDEEEITALERYEQDAFEGLAEPSSEGQS